MKRTLVTACVSVALFNCQTGFASSSGLFFNVTAAGNNLSINTTIPHHTYPAAGIKINTPGYTLAGVGTACVNAGNGYCLFSVSDTQAKSLSITGSTPSGKLSITLCLNGKGPLSCQDYSLSASASACGRFTTGFTGSWSTVANNPFNGGMGFSGYLPQGTPATLYLGDDSNFDSYSSSGNSYTTLTSAPTSFQSYGSIAYFGGSLWSMTNGMVIQYNLTTNTWTTPATGLTTAGSAQTTVDDQGNLWTWQNESNLLEYNIATGTTTTHPVTAGLGSSEPRIVYDSCSGLFYLAAYDTVGFYSYNPSTGTVTTLSSLPGGLTIQDGFCGDRSGHIFAVTDGSNMYQYTISTGTWTEFPVGGLIGSDSSACGVGSDGYLYASDPAASSTVYRIQLK